MGGLPPKTMSIGFFVLCIMLFLFCAFLSSVIELGLIEPLVFFGVILPAFLLIGVPVITTIGKMKISEIWR